MGEIKPTALPRWPQQVDGAEVSLKPQWERHRAAENELGRLATLFHDQVAGKNLPAQPSVERNQVRLADQQAEVEGALVPKQLNEAIDGAFATRPRMQRIRILLRASLGLAAIAVLLVLILV